MKLMLFVGIITLLLLHMTAVVSGQRTCQLHYDIEAFQENNNNGNSLLYIYIPLEVVEITQNSIEIFNEEGVVLDCLNMKQFKKENKLKWENPSFVMMKHIVDNLYVLHFVADENGGSVIRNNAYSLIIDDYFNVKEEYPMLGLSPSLESSIFELDARVNMHDVVVTPDLKHGIIIIQQYFVVTNIQEFFPDSSLESKKIAGDGLCVIDMKTGKESAALSPNGVLFEIDTWGEYVIESQYELFYEDKSRYGSSGDATVDLAHLNSLELVDGSHFSPNYRDEKLLLMTCFTQETAYLIRWDFENKSNGEAEVIWKLPGYRGLEKIRRDWADRWEFVNDPFYGFSVLHDINVFNAPKGHILVFDNGSGHRVSNGVGTSCPMTRALEYEIELNANGRGYHRITLIFSYPKIEDYPEIIYLENEPEFERKDCDDFWDKYNWQTVFGSIRRTNDDYYVLTDYSYKAFASVTTGPTSRMLKLNSDGEIVNEWVAITGNILSYRIIPVERKAFRNGEYIRHSDLQSPSFNCDDGEPNFNCRI